MPGSPAGAGAQQQGTGTRMKRTWIGLFRGINVGGRNLLPMKELVALLVDAGFDVARAAAANPYPEACAKLYGP